MAGSIIEERSESTRQYNRSHGMHTICRVEAYTSAKKKYILKQVEAFK